MTTDERIEHDTEFFAECLAITRGAAKEYADPNNNFANFEDGAAFADMTREQNLAVLLHKHLRGIGNWLDGVKNQRDSIRGRIQDAVNYLVILDAMIITGAELPTKEEFQEYVQAVGQIVRDAK